MTPHTTLDWATTCFAYIGMSTTAFILGWCAMGLWLKIRPIR